MLWVGDLGPLALNFMGENDRFSDDCERGEKGAIVGRSDSQD